MNLPQNCTSYNHPECTVFSKVPPPGFCGRCRHFVYRQSIQEEKPEKQGCDGCYRNDDGYCLRLDHKDFVYNFVKIKEGIECPTIT